jgi:hypothetical protein
MTETPRAEADPDGAAETGKSVASEASVAPEKSSIPQKPEQVRKRVPAAVRREELISAAVHEFARGGLHGTAVERIARRVGVAQASSVSPRRLSGPRPTTARDGRRPTARTRWRRWDARTGICSSPTATT